VMPSATFFSLETLSKGASVPGCDLRKIKDQCNIAEMVVQWTPAPDLVQSGRSRKRFSACHSVFTFGAGGL